MTHQTALSFDYLLLPLLVVVLIIHYLGLFQGPVDQTVMSVVAIMATVPVLASSWKSILHKEISVDLMAAIALFFALLAGEFASAVFINLMITSARIFGHYTENQTRAALKHLLKLKPTFAHLKKGEAIFKVSLSELKPGDIVIVELGERIPADGTVLSGQGSVDQSSFTGESLPVEKQKNDLVLSSTYLLSGSLNVRVDKIGKDTEFEKIIRLVEQSQGSKSKLTTLGQKFAKYYLLTTFLGALLLYLLTKNLDMILAVLLVVCADDIAVATPLAYMGGIAMAARNGIIIKGASFLEGLASIKRIIVDKTGTITQGNLKVQMVSLLHKSSLNQVLEIAGSVCARSAHPVSRAVMAYAEHHNAGSGPVQDLKEFSGKGVSAMYKDHQVLLGRLSFLKENAITLTKQQEMLIEGYQRQGLSVTSLSYDGELIAVFTLADQIKPGTKNIIRELHRLGVKTVEMLTGDHEAVAKNIAEKAGINEFYANMLPEQKLEHLRSHLGNHDLAMIGDGVNDAPALTLADIGIAMGAMGSDASIETADIVLMNDDFSKIPKLIRLSKLVIGIAHSNFIIWGVVNLIGLVLVLSGVMSPSLAAAYNFVTDFIPIANAMRIFRNKELP